MTASIISKAAYDHKCSFRTEFTELLKLNFHVVEEHKYTNFYLVQCLSIYVNSFIK